MLTARCTAGPWDGREVALPQGATELRVFGPHQGKPRVHLYKLTYHDTVPAWVYDGPTREQPTNFVTYR